MRRKEMEALLTERAERIALLEQRQETMNQLIDGYRAREQNVIESLTQATETAKKRIADAEAQATNILGDATARAEETLRQAEARQSAAVAEADAYAAHTAAAAEENANAVIRAAQDEYQRIRRLAVDETNEAYAKVNALNGAVDRSAKALSDMAAGFLAMVREGYLDAEAVVQAAEKAPVANEAPAPCCPAAAAAQAPVATVEAAPVETVTADEAAEDPASVMQSIYKLQQRDIPEEADARLDAEGAPDDERTVAAEEEACEDLAPRPVEDEEEIPREFDDGERVQEWQPEPDADAEAADVPRVSDMLPDGGADDDDLSLDALLDEIIRARD